MFSTIESCHPTSETEAKKKNLLIIHALRCILKTSISESLTASSVSEVTTGEQEHLIGTSCDNSLRHVWFRWGSSVLVACEKRVSEFIKAIRFYFPLCKLYFLFLLSRKQMSIAIDNRKRTEFPLHQWHRSLVNCAPKSKFIHHTRWGM
jgi:hypothetical protein